MYSVISSIATPLIVINASRVYFGWAFRDNKALKTDEIYKRESRLNNFVTASIFITGAAAVYAHATKFQNPTPLIMSAMAYRLVTIFLISTAIWSSGHVLNYHLSRS